jgi:hypothetical protein
VYAKFYYAFIDHSAGNDQLGLAHLGRDSGGFLPPSPLAKKATARQDQAMEPSADGQDQAMEPSADDGAQGTLAHAITRSMRTNTRLPPQQRR